jgi:hypothetical protein
MTTAPQRFVVRYKKNDGSQHTLQLHAANRQEARIVAMEAARTYTKRLLRTLEVNNRVQAVLKGMRCGMVQI